MSCPEPRCLGDGGELASRSRPRDAAPDGTDRAGDFRFVPPGGIHAFRNESGAPASILLLSEGLSEPAASGRELSPQELTDFLRSHDQ